MTAVYTQNNPTNGCPLGTETAFEQNEEVGCQLSNRLTVTLMHIVRAWGEQMGSYALCLLSFSTLLLSGCATMKGIKGAQWPWQQEMPCAAECTDGEVIRAFVASNNYCREVQNYYESGGFYATSSRLAVGTFGALAGSVFSPLADGSAAKAWAGLSGATNALQSQMDEAFSSAVAVRRRAAIATIAADGTQRFLRAATPEEKILIAVDTARACSMGSAVADQGTLRALTGYRNGRSDSEEAGTQEHVSRENGQDDQSIESGETDED